MSDHAQVQTQAKKAASTATARTMQPPLPAQEQKAGWPDIATQMQSAVRWGHSLGAIGVSGPAPAQVQRQANPKEEDRNSLRVGPEGGAAPAEVETAVRQARGGGQPLAAEIRAEMGKQLGHDFSAVRVHISAESDALNQSLGASAFTTGKDIFFRRGAYNPASAEGRELLTHELTHVVQQGGGRAGAEGSGMTVRPAGDAFEQEADQGAGPISRVHSHRKPAPAPLGRGREYPGRERRLACQGSGSSRCRCRDTPCSWG